MKTSKIAGKILEILAEEAKATSDFLGMFLVPYHESYRVVRGFSPRRSSREEIARVTRRKEAQRFYALLSKLKKEGLIKGKAARRGSLWHITSAGRKKLQILFKKKSLEPAIRYANPEVDGKLKIVIFDVPERVRGKRIWLRAALLALDFSLLQKSVWVGKTKIPEVFLADLRERDMLSYVHIFKISKRGTVSELA